MNATSSATDCIAIGENAAVYGDHNIVLGRNAGHALGERQGVVVIGDNVSGAEGQASIITIGQGPRLYVGAILFGQPNPLYGYIKSVTNT